LSRCEISFDSWGIGFGELCSFLEGWEGRAGEDGKGGRGRKGNGVLRMKLTDNRVV
jgi:hypothetical protein